MTDYKTGYSSDKNTNTLQRGSYNDFGDGTPGKQVLAKQPSGEIYEVQFFSGEPIYQYSEVNSLAASATVDLLSYTVPVDKILRLQSIYVFGQNLGEYELLGNGLTIKKMETYFTKYDAIFNFNGLEYLSGEIVKAVVTNKSSTLPANYTATLQGSLVDA